ncbi:hypothetical protein HD553DRAFT_252772, partial [Filobasidium floriforme]|uniref:uncharacterized protein n=1 Tax=Filobasidium floriforme TaxID=5210 RepID=UPI001E8E5727
DRAEKILKKVTIGDSLTLEETRRVANLVRAKHQAFALDLSEVEACPHTSHSLAVDPTKKLTRKPFGRPLTEPEVVAAKKQVEKLLAAGVIERCRPDEVLCCAPIVMAPK